MREYEYGDLINFKARDGDYLNYDASYQADSTTYTLINEANKVVAVMGLIILHEGVAGVWAVISDDARGHGIAVTRYARKLIKRWIHNYVLHRIQTVVRVDREEYKRWIRLIGFEYESTMRKVSPDKRDMECYVLLR